MSKRSEILRRNKQHLAMTFLMLLLVFFSWSVRADTSSSQKTQQATKGFYQELRGFNLIVKVDPRYEGAIKCHDRIMECVQERYGDTDTQPKRKVMAEEYSQRLRAVVKLYPAELYPDVLYDVLKKKMGEAFHSFDAEERGEPEFHMPLVGQEKMNKSYYEKVIDAVSDPDFLTVTLGVEIFEEYKPKTALLTLRYHRAGESGAGYFNANQMNLSALISLEGSREEIQAAVDDAILNKNFSIIKPGKSY